MKGGRKKSGAAPVQQQQQVRPPPNADEMNGDAAAEAADAEERQLDYEEEGYEEDEEGGEEEEIVERPKLAEGFYEIEAVRRKRVRKGQAQYLIKWRGWPETANTWEPVENLSACPDVIDAFEESLRSGKHRSRKRRRKSAALTPKTQKKPQRSAGGAENVRVGRVQFVEEHVVIPCHDGESRNNSGETGMRGINNGENGFVTAPQQVEEGNGQNEMDLNLGESKGNVANLAVDIQESETTEVVSHMNGQSKDNGERPGLNGGGRMSSRKRKSSVVKKFKPKPAVCVTNYAVEDVTPRNTRVCEGGQQRAQNPVGPTITEIIKPVSLRTSESDNNHDIAVTFSAKRSDGSEVMVDNKYLKAHDPILLISYYERHLKYNAT